VVLNVTTKGSN